MSVHEDLLRACANGDEVALGRHGWRPIYEALVSWWPREFTRDDLRPYVRVLADEKPEAILGALRAHTTTKGGGFRPLPAEVRALIHAEDEVAAPRHGGYTNPSEGLSVLERVAAAISAGETVCECPCPTSRAWLIDPPPLKGKPPRGIWRCPECGWIEQGQVYAAEDAGLIWSVER